MRTSITPGGKKEIRSEKLWAEFSFPKERKKHININIFLSGDCLGEGGGSPDMDFHHPGLLLTTVEFKNDYVLGFIICKIQKST